jgi:NTE family protein
VLQGFLRRTRSGDRSVDASDRDPDPIAARPSIGLALGGGAARGLAHIGVLQTLLAHGIKPDVITGTSMGAVVGGCCAAGRLDAAAAWARSLTRRRVLSYLDVSLSGSGLISGGRLARQLESTVGSIKIEELATRFAAIATEIDTGHEVWLTRGRLLEALRASYALPGMFAPVHVGGRWLVDGALVNPVPVSATRALDARLVIGVSTNADLFARGTTIHSHGFIEDEMAVSDEAPGTLGAARLITRKLVNGGRRPGLPTVMFEAYNVMQDRITRARLAGDPADITISPRLSHIGLFEFHRAEEAIAIGAEAAERALDTILQATTALA